MDTPLPHAIQQHLLTLSGKCGFAVQHFPDGKIICYQNRRFVAASTIKLPLMSAFWDAVEAGRFELDELWPFNPADVVEDSPAMAELLAGDISWEQLLEWMIVVSDNTATNLVLDGVGLYAVNQWLQRAGFCETFLNRRMMDLAARAQGIDNWTTPLEMLNWMARLVNSELISPEADQAMLACLFRQQDLEKIPSGFQAPIRVANKPGELPGNRSDVGYVTDGSNQMLISIFCDELQQEETVDEWIGILARLWWAEFTNS